MTIEKAAAAAFCMPLSFILHGEKRLHSGWDTVEMIRFCAMNGQPWGSGLKEQGLDAQNIGFHGLFSFSIRKNIASKTN